MSDPLSVARIMSSHYKPEVLIVWRAQGDTETVTYYTVTERKCANPENLEPGAVVTPYNEIRHEELREECARPRAADGDPNGEDWERYERTKAKAHQKMLEIRKKSADLV